jgi:hypothetical protein
MTQLLTGKVALGSLAAVFVLNAAVPSAWASTATTTALTATASGSAVTTAASGTAITLTATVMAGSTAVTPGQVNFCDASAAHCTDIHLLGTAQLTSSGTATFKFVPGIGSHSYKAVFLGTTSKAASTSGAAALTVTGTGAYSTATSIAQNGSAGSYTLTATVSGKEGILPAGDVSFLDTSNSNYSLGSATLAASDSAAVLSFFKSSSPATNPYPQAVAVADFNGDGKADLAVPVYSIFTPISDVSILLGNGDGTFTAAPVTPITGQNAGSVAVGDFNEDGKPDLAITLPDANAVQIMLGNGDGSFTASQTIPDVNGPFFVTTGDFNGDGIADLAVVSFVDGNLAIFLGSGDGTFTEKSSPVSGGPPLAAAVGDFNGDGKADLAVVNYSGTTSPGTLTILLGNGDGTFTAATASPATGNDPISVAIGDFNGDGKADLAVANSYIDTGELGSVTVLLGNGDGTFTPTPANPATGSMPYSIAVGDVNGDGIADLVTANVGSNDATVLLGNGDGTFTEAGSPAAGTDPLFLALGDFNGDGLADLAAANNSTSSITVLVSQLTETATASIGSISVVGTGTHSITASYPGDANYATSISGTTSLTAQTVATTLSLNANPSSSNSGEQVVFTATVTPSAAQGHSPSGSITFLNGGTTLGTGTLSSGIATLSLTSLPTGTDSITATYAGDTNFGASAASAVTEIVTAPNYSIAANPGSLSIAQGGTGTAVFTITPTGGFNRSIQLACSGLPTDSTCSFSPATLTPNGAAVSSTLTISTNTQSTSLVRPSGNTWLALGIPFGPAGLASLFGWLGIRKRKTVRNKGCSAQWLLFLGAISFAVLAIGCGGRSSSSISTGPLTPVGAYTVTVTASTTASGGPTQKATLTLTVVN